MYVYIIVHIYIWPYNILFYLCISRAVFWVIFPIIWQVKLYYPFWSTLEPVYYTYFNAAAVLMEWVVHENVEQHLVLETLCIQLDFGRGAGGLKHVKI